MTTTVQNIIDRAVDRNLANRGTSLTQSTVALIKEVDSYARNLRQALIDRNHTFFFHEETKASSAAASARILDLDALTSAQKVGRLIALYLPSTEEISIVDYKDREAALAPRGYPKKKTIVEIGSEWGTTGAITITVAYNIGVTQLTLTGATTQTVTVDDEYAWLLDNRLARYFAAKDVGRSSDELENLDAEYNAGFESYVDWLTDIAGPQTLRNPPSVPQEKE
jgi:hypothetical protein